MTGRVVMASTLPSWKMNDPGCWGSWLTHAETIRNSHPDGVDLLAVLELDARGREPFAPLLDRLADLDGHVWTFHLDDGAQKIDSRNRLARICTGRNLATHYAIDNGAGWLLYADADTVIPGDALPKLLAVDWPIVGGRVPTYCLGTDAPRLSEYDFPVKEHMNAQPLWASVLTPDGWAKMGDLRVGDVVVDPDGEPSIVTGVYPRGDDELWRLTLADGSEAVATADHLWRVDTGRGQRRRECVMRTEDIRRRLQTKSGAATYIRPMRPYDGNRALPISPYVLGAIIGDGTVDASLRLTCGDAGIVDAIQRELPEGVVIESAATPTRPFGYRIKDRSAGGRGNRNRMVVALQDLGLHGCRAWEKHLPDACLHLSAADRLALLQGLMDTDGCVSAKGQASFSTTARRLAADVVDLVRSLGGRTTVSPARQSMWTSPQSPTPKMGRPWYQVNVSLPYGQIPFRLERKVSRYVVPKWFRGWRVASVEPTGMHAQVQCIEVSAKSRCYVTDDYIATHNTAGFLLVRRDLFTRLRWRTDPDQGLTDDPCYHADATALGYPTRVREDCVAAHWPPAIGPVEGRPHDLTVYR